MKKISLLVICTLLFISCTANVNNQISVNLESPVSAEEVDNSLAVERGPIIIETLSDIEKAVSLMTLEEKAGQMLQAERGGLQLSDISTYNIGSILSGGGSVPDKNTPEGWVNMINRMLKVSRNSSSGIPIIYGVDAVHGHNNVKDAVIFPHNIGLGAADNPSLVYDIGASVAKTLEATGVHWNFAPAVSIVQDIRWGRSYESFSEDVARVAILGAAYVDGLQSQGIMATTKHFIGDGYTTYGTGEGTNLIDRGDVTVPMAQLLSLYLPAYEAAIDAGTKTIMASFNSVEGIKIHEHRYLLTDVLRTELGFEGVVISDWEAINAISGTLEEKVAASINAGVDMLMEPYNWKAVIDAIIYNVDNRIISEARIDEAVSRILTLKYEAGLFNIQTDKEAGLLNTEADKTLARSAVSQSMVLLKNKENLLPLRKDIKIYLTGPASDHVGIQCGGWTLSWQGEMDPDLNQGTSLKDALSFVLSENGGALVSDPEDADLIILAIGEMPYTEMMGDTADLSLNGPKSLTENIPAIESSFLSNKPIVTIMVAGRPLLVDDYIDQWDAFVMAWLPGTEGLGMTDVLFGDSNFVGTLPVTWPKNNEQAGESINNIVTNDYQYPYGYGLQYK